MGSVEKNVIVLLLTGCLVVGRLLVENVEACPAKPAFQKGGDELGLIDELPSPDVDQDAFRAQRVDHSPVDYAPGFLRQRARHY